MIAVAMLPLILAIWGAAFLADLTFKTSAMIGAVILSVVLWYGYRHSAWREREVWTQQAVKLPPDEADFAKAASVREQRAAFVCSADPAPRDWTGVVDAIYLSATANAAILTIRIGPELLVRTLSDFSVRPAVLVGAGGRPGDLTTLAVGDHVRFSAELLRDGRHCLRTTGGGEKASDRDLGFLANFTRIERIEDAGAS
jgi:hypothetical protein